MARKRSSISGIPNLLVVGERCGRDEMNLAEFPLASLSKRPRQDQKTLVFEDVVPDRGRGVQVTRRLTISASDKYGLPTPLDDDVILGLIQITRTQEFQQRRIPFNRHQLIGLLGWRSEGKSYERLDVSLKRWLGVTLYYENAWRDKAEKAWVDEHFHILDDVVLYDRERSKRRREISGESSQCTFTWNEIVFRSFQAGNLKPLDFGLYRKLKSAIAKRMFRFLDKRFYHKGTWSFDLRTFACEHIGLSRNFDVAQLRRELVPAIEELEREGFLKPSDPKEQFVSERRGQWQIVLRRSANGREAADLFVAETPLVAELITRGVHRRSALELVAQYDVDRIRAQMSAFDSMRKDQHSRISKNPAGFLVASIRRDFQTGSPKPVKRPPLHETVLPLPKIRAMESAERRLHNEAESRWRRMSLAEQDEIDAKAMRNADDFSLDGLRRAREAGNARLLAAYREAICIRFLVAQLSSRKPIKT